MILVSDRIAWSRYPGGREFEGVVVNVEWWGLSARKDRGGKPSKRVTTVYPFQKPRKVGV